MTKDELSSLTAASVLIPILIDAESEKSNSARLTSYTGDLEIPLSARLLLTVRTHTVEHHKGQISFPGGVFENDDRSLRETALRETYEEIGLERNDVDVVAELPEVPTFASRFLVKPFVGIVRNTPTLKLNPDEIGEILYVPLSHLFDPNNSALETFERNGMRYQIRTYFYNENRIWGATGFILQTLLEKFFVQL